MRSDPEQLKVVADLSIGLPGWSRLARERTHCRDRDSRDVLFPAREVGSRLGCRFPRSHHRPHQTRPAAATAVCGAVHQPLPPPASASGRSTCVQDLHEHTCDCPARPAGDRHQERTEDNEAMVPLAVWLMDAGQRYALGSSDSRTPEP